MLQVNREKVMSKDSNRVNVTAKHYLYAKHLAIEQRVTEFLEFSCDQRLVVSKISIEGRARTIEFFKASNVWF